MIVPVCVCVCVWVCVCVCVCVCVYVCVCVCVSVWVGGCEVLVESILHNYDLSIVIILNPCHHIPSGLSLVTYYSSPRFPQCHSVRLDKRRVL